MAHETAKKNARNNAARLRMFRLISIAVVVGSLAIDALWTGRSDTWYGFLTWAVFWGAHNFIPLFFLTAVGRPTLGGSSGAEVVECIDMSNPSQLGYYSYAQDILWFCWFLQPLQSLFSNYFMLLYAPIPLFIAYKIFNMVVAPILNARSQMAAMGAEQQQQQQQQMMMQQQQQQQQQQMQQQQQQQQMQGGGGQGRMSARAMARREARGK